MAIDTMPAAAPVSPTTDPEQGSWTYEAYLTLPTDGNRYEVIDGVLYVAPAPTPKHQRRLFRLAKKVDTYVIDNALGEVLIAPIDVLMPGASPVQPDVIFIAHDNADVVVEDENIQGVPDLVIEVTSPSTAGYDRREKQDLYARAGVRELWHVHPAEVTIEVLILDASRGIYQSRGVSLRTSRVPSEVLAGLPFTVDELLS